MWQGIALFFSFDETVPSVSRVQHPLEDGWTCFS
nr:MAG TPA: Protein of unknown function (DUF2674) [Caudoviricetes sp.]